MLISPEDFRPLFAYTLFLFGLVFVGAGFWRLLAITLNTQAKNLAVQSARIGQKAIGDDVARVTQATQQLLDSVNSLLRTTAGVGAFLIFVGLLLLTSSYCVLFVAR
jgi:hypothetical protein